MDEREDVVAEVGSAEAAETDPVFVIEQGGLVILDGPPDLVAELISTEPVLRDAAQLSVSGGASAGAMAQIAGLLESTNADQVAFQLNDKGMEMFRQGTLSSTGDGWVRAFGRAADGTISGHAAIKPLLLAPQQVLTAQLAITTVALTAAIREVQEAVERVERKVDVLKDLIEAELVGSILGAHRSLHRRAQQVGFSGAMSDTDWYAIDSLGVEVEQQIEVVRSFVRKRLQAATDEGMRIADRRDAITYIEDLAETLKLLVVAQDSLFLFQQLRLVRIRDREPLLLPAALAEATELLEGQKREDVELLDAVRAIVSGRVEIKALEIHRFMSAKAVVASAGSVDDSLASFSSQRSLSYDPIHIPPVPQVAAAIEELRDRGSSLAGDAKHLASALVRRSRGPDESALPAGTVPAAEIEPRAASQEAAHDETDPASSSVASVTNSLRSVRDRASSRLWDRKDKDSVAERDSEDDVSPTDRPG